MTAYLLRLADLEAAAPGILKVIFGPDGDIKNAPPFAGPVSVIKAQPDLMVGGYLWIHGGLTPDGIWDGAGRLTPFDAVALDCRVPGVAVRLLGLCAYAAWRSRQSIPSVGQACTAAHSSVLCSLMPWAPAHAVLVAHLTLSLADMIVLCGGAQ